MKRASMVHQRWLVLALTATSALTLASGVSARGGRAVPGLAWRGCAEEAQRGFECATARVPLDYHRPASEQIRLAVIRHAATDSANRIGTMFFNPGGPGGAGTEDLPNWYQLFPAALRARFDLVSWDPRGIGDSTAVQCFASDRREARFLGAAAAAFPQGRAQQRLWTRTYRAFGRRCAKRNGALLRHVSTKDSARDLDLLRRAVGSPQLSYLGVSYGTLLGATYANLFPTAVRALVLDGNVDPVAWSQPGRLDTSLRLHSDQATGTTATAFLNLCGRAGRARCAFSAGSARATRAKFAALVRRVRAHPQRFRGDVIDLPALLSSFAGILYTPQPEPGGFPGWTDFAQLLQALWRRANPTPPPTPPVQRRYAGPEQAAAVQCSDSPNPPRPAAYPGFARLSVRRSGLLGLTWVWGDFPCASWPARAADRYAGPWNRPTANPILVVGNTGDPSTAYRGSVRMARLLARGRLLTVTGYGHTELLNPSRCVARREVAYFLTGALPPTGTVCRQNTAPFARGEQR
jgi:pimeloyl-ACP methyl ester carboxylesterase